MKNILTLSVIFYISTNVNALWQQTMGGNPYPIELYTDETSDFIIASFATAGIWKTENKGLDWDPINNNIFSEPYLTYPYILSSNIFFLDSNGDTIVLNCIENPTGLATNGSTTYLSIDRGNSWTFLDENFTSIGASNNQECLIIDQQNHNIMYYINDYYFAFSLDFGENWQVSIIDSSYYGKNSLYEDNQGNIYFTSSYYYDNVEEKGGVCCSSDTGQTWNLLIPFYELWSLDFASVQNFCILSNGEWIAAVDFTGPVLWEDHALLLSSDSGATWERLGDGLPPRYQPSLLVEDPYLPGRLYIIGNQKYGLYFSNDYGRNWTRCLNGLPENVSICGDLVANPYSGDIYVTIDSYGIYRSSDNGASWETINMPPVGANGFISLFSQTIYYRDYGYRLWRTNSNLIPLTEMEVPINPDTLIMFRPIAYQNGDTLITGIWKRPFAQAVDFFQMTRSYDNGQSWSYGLFLPFLPSNIKTYFDTNIVRFICTDIDKDSLLFSENLGETWNMINFPYGSIIDYIQDTEDIIVGSSSQVYKYDIINDYWIPLNFTGVNFKNFLGLLGEDIYVASWEPPISHCYYYHQGNWEQRGEMNLFIGLSQIIPTSENTIFFTCAMCYNFVFLSYDYGFNWDSVAYELPYPTQTFGFYDLKYDPYRDLIWASTGAGLCYMEVEQLSVRNQPFKFKPVDTFSLNAYPNPFNSTTTISFNLPLPGPTSLIIYDINGREIIKLFDEYKSAGNYQIKFDGDKLASGVYLANLNTGIFRTTKKLLLIK